LASSKHNPYYSGRFMIFIQGSLLSMLIKVNYKLLQSFEFIILKKGAD
jgi:hypothetical protein